MAMYFVGVYNPVLYPFVGGGVLYPSWAYIPMQKTDAMPQYTQEPARHDRLVACVRFIIDMHV
jgi:hypothetical protein